MAKITHEIAQKEVSAWLDAKKIMQSVKESNEDSIQLLEEALVEGIISIDEKTKVITHNLRFPLGEGEEIKTVEYRHRINDRLLEPYLKGIKPTDSDGRLAAYICALTTKSRGIIKSMDSVDKKIAMAVAVFFL